jgi:hypothetical protein
VPAAAVIPAPIAYIKVVAVKKLVVEPLASSVAASVAIVWRHPSENLVRPLVVGLGIRHFTLKKLECLRQAIALNTQAWNNGIGPWSILLVIGPR